MNGRNGFIRGIVKDFHFASMREKIRPMAFLPERDFNKVLMRVSGQNLENTLSKVQERWRRLAPNVPFEYQFMDEEYNNLYNSEQKLSKLFGIFATLFGAIALNAVPGMEFTLKDASAIAIIGGADGPTAIFLASKLAPELLGAIAVAAYSYMALVPIIQPPIMKALTTEDERKIEMAQLRPVTKIEKIIFPLGVLLMTIFFLPAATPLVGMFCLGNLMKESGVVDRLSSTAQNELINIVTIFLGLGVGSKLSAEAFLNVQTLGILALGAVAFSIGTASGVLMAKMMNKLSKEKVNPLIGAAGVSAVPMAARVANKVGLEANPHNFLLMHAMGPNVAGVLGSAVAAGILLALVG